MWTSYSRETLISETVWQTDCTLLKCFSISIYKNKIGLYLLNRAFPINLMTIHSDIDSRDSDSISEYLDSKIKRKRRLIKKKTKKLKGRQRKKTKRSKTALSSKIKKNIKKLKQEQLRMNSKEVLILFVTDRVRNKIIV